MSLHMGTCMERVVITTDVELTGAYLLGEPSPAYMFWGQATACLTVIPVFAGMTTRRL
jgi:hypothetical protein